MQEQRFVPRDQLWRQRYRAVRDLDHMPPEALSERVFDCMNNSRARTEEGQLGFVEMPAGEQWLIRMTEIFEECALRGYDYPGPINLSEYGSALEHAFAPIPSMDPYLAGMQTGKYVMKFGSSKWLPAALDKGEFLLSPASYYERKEHDHARQDRELSRILSPNPRDSSVRAFLSNQQLTAPRGKAVKTVELREQFDYYLFSLTASYSSRLFGDFNADACLLIHKPAIFLQRLIQGMRKVITDAECEIGPVQYFDPIRTDPSLVDVPFWKPFSHSYQSELRVIWVPSNLQLFLPRIEVEIGSLRDCATLITL
jgi:hypothetical protein